MGEEKTQNKYETGANASDSPKNKALDAAATATAHDLANSNKNMKMNVKVYAPFKTYFDGEAFSISAANDTGPFDILPKHHNFMTLLSTCEVVVRTESSEERIQINRGIMHVKADEVKVFLDV